jgi:copper homeostasis protein
MITFEVCIDTPEGIVACANGRADRIELCSSLSLGGLTPSAGLMALAAAGAVPAHAMIRPVAGGFAVNDAVLETMLQDIKAAKSAGLAGVVLGATTPDYNLDEAKLRPMLNAAGSMEVTLHRAIDLCTDPLHAVEQAIALGFARILTSGGETTAMDGSARIAEMVKQSAGRIEIMAGSGVSAANVMQLLKVTGVQNVHASCSSTEPEAKRVSEMAFGPAQRKFTDVEKIIEMKSILGRSSLQWSR